MISEEELRERLKKEIYVKVAGPYMCRPLHGITDIWARLHGKVIQLKMGFIFPGVTSHQMNMNPFDEKYHEPSINGLGLTLESAWKSLERDAKLTAESYWV